MADRLSDVPKSQYLSTIASRIPQCGQHVAQLRGESA